MTGHAPKAGITKADGRAGAGGGGSREGVPWWRGRVVRWAVFYALCAAGAAGLPWFATVLPMAKPFGGVAWLVAMILLPLACVLVPILVLRRVPRKQRKLAWQVCVPLVASVVLFGVVGSAADEAALAERGQWTQAVVTERTNGKTDRCALRRPDGQEIAPDLTEGEGCGEYVERGDAMRVRFDPEGAAAPVTYVEEPGSYRGWVAGLIVLIVATGTWGAVRMTRWDEAYEA